MSGEQASAPRLCERCWYPVHPDQPVRWFEHRDIVDGRVRTLISVVHGSVCPSPYGDAGAADAA